MTDVLNVQIREQTGTNAVKKVRKAGFTPAVLYGHGQESMSLSIPKDELQAAIRHGSQLVELDGAVQDSALIREVQWDTFGYEVVHFDLIRVRAGEKVEVSVALSVRGEAPGIKDGGVVEIPLHEIAIECPAGSIPSEIKININNLELGDSIKVADLELPEGASVITDSEIVVVQCVEPTVVDEEAAEAVPGEPEVIGARDDEESEE